VQLTAVYRELAPQALLIFDALSQTVGEVAGVGMPVVVVVVVVGVAATPRPHVLKAGIGVAIVLAAVGVVVAVFGGATVGLVITDAGLPATIRLIAALAVLTGPSHVGRQQGQAEEQSVGEGRHAF
jgi:type III secretory pathway component EscS